MENATNKYTLKNPIIFNAKQIKSNEDFDGFVEKCDRDYFSDRCDFCYDGYCQDYKYDEDTDEYTEERICPNCPHRKNIGYIDNVKLPIFSMDDRQEANIGDYVVETKLYPFGTNTYRFVVDKETFEKIATKIKGEKNENE